jgi:cysteine desulfurase / selenocysteine lyase
MSSARTPMTRRVYLDNAATSWPKPEEVYDAVLRYMRENGAAAGRGAYRSAVEAARLVTAARQQAAAAIGADDPRRVAFASNGTDALNLALHGILRPGDHVVTTDAEHNSVLRPLAFLRAHRDIDVTYVAVDGTGRVDPADIRRAVRPSTRLLAILHASNVTGAIQPLDDVLRVAREHELLTLIDAAQTAGHLPIDVERRGIDLLATSGHKGLLGPLGTGLLYVGPRAEPLLKAMRQGGTGSVSDQEDQPETLPDRLESGNLNVPGLAGLERGLAFLRAQGGKVREHELALTRGLLDRLRELPPWQVLGPDEPEERVGVVSLRLPGYDPQDLAAILDAEYGVEARSGLHCAPRIHRHLGTVGEGGTLRLSVGPLTQAADVDAALLALADLAAHSG